MANKIFFITGNKNKFAEAKLIIPQLEQLDIDLIEIQEIDSNAIIESKLHEAQKHHTGSFIVEDSSLSLQCLGGFPGPLIKWFLKTNSKEEIAHIADTLGNTDAIARVTIGYLGKENKIHFFEGEIAGTISRPAGDNGFSWDVIFIPNGYDKTFAQMSRHEKNKISARALAFNKFKKFLDAKDH